MLSDEKQLRRDILKRFKKRPDGYYSVTNYNQKKFAWLGVVVKKSTPLKITILSVGMEITEAAIREWCAGVIDNRSKGGTAKSDPPDMAERSRVQ